MQLVILAASIMVPGPQNTVGLALGTNDGVTVGLALLGLGLEKLNL